MAYENTANWFRKLVSFLLILPVVFYQKAISPFLPNSCRFYPSCSEYTKQAILLHGPLRGMAFGVKRIVCCNPWCEGGIDPVPEKK